MHMRSTVGRTRAGPWLRLAALLALGAAPCMAQDVATQAIRADRADGLPVGTVIERVISAADSTQSHAVYLPSRYDPERRWPILFIMDARGRALLPLERLTEAAERYGYILMSSYDTRSDYLRDDPNEPALRAMLRDAQALFSVDTRRFYLAGWSGTARAAYFLGVRLLGHVAGVIGVGGGMPPALYDADLSPLREAEFAFYGLAGTRDYNYEEMRQAKQLLDDHGLPNGLAFFEGRHTWAPAEKLADAVAWLELRAMRAGLRPLDGELVDSLYDARLARTDTLLADGDSLAAYHELAAVAVDFTDVLDVDAVRERADRLRRSEAVEAGLDRAERFGARFWAVAVEYDEFVRELADAESPPDPNRIAEKFALPALVAEAGDTADPEAADAAARILGHIFVDASFYQPRRLMRQDRLDHALAMLDIADRIYPERPRVCLYRARALAAAERFDEALDAATCALNAGIPIAAIIRDPRFTPLHEMSAFMALLGRF